VLLNGLGYRIDAYELLLKETGKFFGAGYTAVNASLLAYNVAMVLSFIAAAPALHEPGTEELQNAPHCAGRPSACIFYH
jgi:uncharacterized membrane protein (UPF0182 family)